jgi:hypothetical protein
MRPYDEFEVIFLAETLSHIWAEHDRDASFTGMTTISVSRVRPETIYHGTTVFWLSLAVNFANLVESNSVLGEKASVRDKHLLVNAVGKRERPEHLTEELVNFFVVLDVDFSLEAVEFI